MLIQMLEYLGEKSRNRITLGDLFGSLGTNLHGIFFLSLTKSLKIYLLFNFLFSTYFSAP